MLNAKLDMLAQHYLKFLSLILKKKTWQPTNIFLKISLKYEQ